MDEEDGISIYFPRPVVALLLTVLTIVLWSVLSTIPYHVIKNRTTLTLQRLSDFQTFADIQYFAEKDSLERFEQSYMGFFYS